MNAMTWLVVALGGALGSVARFGVGLWMLRLTGPSFPWGTLLINIVGSFIIAFTGGLTLEGGAMPASFNARAFVMVGICGGFTTFSSFSMQTMELLQAGETAAAAGYVAGSAVLCIAAAFLGYWVASRLGVAIEVGR